METVKPSLAVTGLKRECAQTLVLSRFGNPPPTPFSACVCPRRGTRGSRPSRTASVVLKRKLIPTTVRPLGKGEGCFWQLPDLSSQKRGLQKGR